MSPTRTAPSPGPTVVTGRWARTAAAVDAATPPSRDRVLDALRAFAIAVVVGGHWLMAVVDARGGLEGLSATNLLVVAPWTRWLTLGLQVMPLFFLVGGVVNARSWRSARARGVGYGGWLGGRAVRLLRPAVPLLAVWALGAPALGALGVDAETMRLASQVAVVPLWFVATYLLVVAVLPPLVALHERAGLRVVTGLAVAVAVVDALHLAGVPAVGWLNFLLVWAGASQLGVCWGDGLLEPRGLRIGLPLAGVALLVGLIEVAGYPLAMVGVDGAARSNTLPPSLALVALAWMQTGAVLALRAPLARLVARPTVWLPVVALNRVAMTVFAWHVTVMIAVVGVTAVTGLWPPIEPLSTVWWLTRPLWLAGLGVLLAGLVVVVGRGERGAGRGKPGTGRAGTDRSRVAPATAVAPALVAVAVAAGGIAGLVLGGLAPYGPLGATPLALTAIVAAATARLSSTTPR